MYLCYIDCLIADFPHLMYLCTRRNMTILGVW